MINENTFVSLSGYENLYEINHLGNIRSKGRSAVDKLGRHYEVKSRVMATRVRRNGYMSVNLTGAGKRSSSFFVHRLLALTFIPNPQGKCCVNHKNGCKLDNSLTNLEWVTYSENNRHALAFGLRKAPPSKRISNHCTGEEFPSERAAASFYRINRYKLRKLAKSGRAGCLRYAA
jgi:hypothetical protein